MKPRQTTRGETEAPRIRFVFNKRKAAQAAASEAAKTGVPMLGGAPDMCGCCHHAGHKGTCDLHCPACKAEVARVKG